MSNHLFFRFINLLCSHFLLRHARRGSFCNTARSSSVLGNLGFVFSGVVCTTVALITTLLSSKTRLLAVTAPVLEWDQSKKKPSQLFKSLNYPCAMTRNNKGRVLTNRRFPACSSRGSFDLWATFRTGSATSLSCVIDSPREALLSSCWTSTECTADGPSALWLTGLPKSRALPLVIQ